MKPRIVKLGQVYECHSIVYSALGFRLQAFGFGKTPADAYKEWSAHWAVRKYGK